MKPLSMGAGLLVLVVIAAAFAGCTSQPAATPAGSSGQAAPAATASGSTAAATTAAVAPSQPPASAANPVTATPSPAATVCPEINGAGILQGSWDTRAVGISNGIDSAIADGGWASIQWAPKLVLTQSCWDISGTYQDVSGTGPVSGTITYNPVTKQFTAAGTWANHAGSEGDSGQFTLTMAADNQSFEGYILTIPPDSPDTGSYPMNWAGKRS